MMMVVVNESSGEYQLQTTTIHKVLSGQHKAHPNAFAVVGITAYDLYSGSAENNFVYGEADPERSVGVISLARYINYTPPPTALVTSAAAPLPTPKPNLSYAKAATATAAPAPTATANTPSPAPPVSAADAAYDLLLRRSCKTVAHEITHLFGVDHCLYYHCVMNGANHDGEDIRQPMFMCPIDLRKLQFACGFDSIARYRKLSEFCTAHGWQAEAVWLTHRIQTLNQFTAEAASAAAAKTSKSNA